ncbi:hypothetical protein V8G54_015561 [Vigna mungo]|uniref:Protein-serine/threonine kinase n=1 Tax=Vigna mungo TaxID=3915 RepID=A0AAQ3NLG5_VIGMU
MSIKAKQTLPWCKSLMKEVKKWSALKQTGVSLRYMMEFGSNPTPNNLLISAQFLHKELPIRIAKRAIELHALPKGLSQTAPVLKVLSFTSPFGVIGWFLLNTMNPIYI